MSNLLIKDLKVRQGDFELNIHQLEVSSGEVLGIMGNSGSGKTTLLNAIAGFVPLNSGTLSVAGSEIQGLTPEKRRVAVVFQQPWLFENLTVLENICFGLKLQNRSQKEAEDEARNWLKKLEISDLGKRRAWEISGGQAQRVALARALAVGFPIVLLDEPFASLDIALRRGLRKLFSELVRESGVTAVLVSHDWKDLDGVAAKIAILNSGKIVAVDSLDKLKSHEQEEIRTIFEN